MICQNGIVTVVINVGRLHPHPNNLTKMISNTKLRILFNPRVTLGSIFRSWGPGQGPTSLEWIIAWVELVGRQFGRTSLGTGKSQKDTKSCDLF